MMCSFLIRLIGTLFLYTRATSTLISCPAVGDDPVEVIVPSTKLVLFKSTGDSLCTLVHIKHANSTNISEVTITNDSPSIDFVLTPIGRSYNKNDWEVVPGPFERKFGVKLCRKWKCITRLRQAGKYFLITYAHSLPTFDEKLSRFFMQTTFGPSKDMIANWSYEKNNVGMGHWIRAQMSLPATKHRVFFRKYTDNIARNNTAGDASIGVQHPCAPYSRWRKYTFSSFDSQHYFDVVALDGKLVIVIDGAVRTVVDSFVSTDGTLSGVGSYECCWVVQDRLGGRIEFKRRNTGDSCSVLDGGNPPIELNQNAIDTYGQLLRFIDLPDESNFEEVKPFIAQDYGNYALIMQTWRMNDPLGLFSSDPILCSSLDSDYQYLVGRLPGGGIMFYHGNVELMENSVESPISDGGRDAVNAGARMCSNVAKNPLNVESCFLADYDACQTTALGRHYWELNPVVKKNVVVCGNDGEVSNDLTLDSTDPRFFLAGHNNNLIQGTLPLQMKAVSYTIFMTANDQLRQRMAWALSQILVITPNQINSDSTQSEIYLNYYDIFVRHAFGNYRDILQEVAYSPMMGEMLTYLDSRSASYVLRTEGRISRPDENFARELMQLFTIGLHQLRADGRKRLREGEPVPTYENSDIQTFARAWTGFRRQYHRFNIEGLWWMPNRIDPMALEGIWRDPFPKLDLNQGFIGDGYPLCTELPTKQFLKKGATYRLIGSANAGDLEFVNRWYDFSSAQYFQLDSTNSQLYETLCNADQSGLCNFQPIVVLDENLDCFGNECDVDNVYLVIVQEDIKYEYVKPACVALSFSSDQELTKISDRYRKTMCLNKRVDDVAMHACCAASDNPDHWLGKYAENYCAFSFEKSSYSTNQDRCRNMTIPWFSNPGTCDWWGIRSYSNNENPNSDHCHFWMAPDWASWHWTDATCSIMAKVNNAGLISIVHNPNLDLNIQLAANNETLQSIYQVVNPDNINFFKVKWEGDGHFPSTENQCANNACISMGYDCLCNIEILQNPVFTAIPTVEDIISTLKIGHVAPDSFPDGTFTLSSTENGVSLYTIVGESLYSHNSVFSVEYQGKRRYFKNMESIVQISGSTSYRFRNPPSFINIAKPDTRDAIYETDAVLDHFFYHSNTAPFLVTQLIKRFGISNPSYRYIDVVATAFRSGIYTYPKAQLIFGDGKYGNLESTIAAIILDREARSVTLDADPSTGSLREPLLKVTSFMRAMEYVRSDNVTSVMMQGLQDLIGQEIFAIPNVFSFFLPHFAPPGKIAEASLTAPEAQVLDSPKIIGLLNGLYSLVDIGMTNCYGGFADRNAWWCDGYKYYTPEQMYSRGFLMFTPENPTNGDDVINEMSLLLTGGRLNPSTKSRFVQYYNDEFQSNGAPAALKFVQKLILATPEFHSTNVFDSIELPRPQAPLPVPSSNDYKAIVYVNLDGGLDSFNLLVPHSNCNGDTAEYTMFDQYSDVRGDIALDKGSLHTIDSTTSGQVCNTFGLHQSLPFLKTLYDTQDLIFLANVGVLQQPVTKDDWWQKTGKTSLFAHNTQQDEINYVDIYDEEAGRGVCGRMLDLLAFNGYYPGAISLNGIAASIRSNSAPMVVMDSSGYQEFNPTKIFTRGVLDQSKAVNTASSIKSSLFADAWSDALFQAFSENELMYDELSNAIVNANFPNTDLGKQLSSVAKVMKTKDARGTDRDVFNVKISGFDHHSQIDGQLTEKFKIINDALEAFVIELRDHQHIWDDVAVVVVSEFARTLMGNTGNGSDHAWGGNYFIASGSVDGGKILGSFPSDLTNDGPHVFEGVVIPTSPWESLWNGVAQWFGIVSTNDLTTVLPNRNTFLNNLWMQNDIFTA